MSKYQKTNIIVGWISFAIAAVVYFLTLEPTVSFWDCGEFITSAYKLEIGHAPGAPFFLLLARFFSMFASDTENVALMINSMSGLASAFTILFLFWTITHLAKKLIVAGDKISESQVWTIIGSGFIGAMAYAFTDTFWFSAVEGEVYATSSLFTAVVFWCVLKWENEEGKAYANRWLILIAYLMGLSIGVHLLNLLAIPAIVMVYYFKKYEPQKWSLKSFGCCFASFGWCNVCNHSRRCKTCFCF
ncbi:glycosyltransferase family 117 protein [Labilibaculum euxinus]